MFDSQTSNRPVKDSKYACEKCTAEGKTCFTWTGKEFQLLPLYPEWRQHQVAEIDGEHSVSPYIWINKM